MRLEGAPLINTQKTGVVLYVGVVNNWPDQSDCLLGKWSNLPPSMIKGVKPVRTGGYPFKYEYYRQWLSGFIFLKSGSLGVWSSFLNNNYRMHYETRINTSLIYL